MGSVAWLLIAHRNNAACAVILVCCLLVSPPTRAVALNCSPNQLIALILPILPALATTQLGHAVIAALLKRQGVNVVRNSITSE